MYSPRMTASSSSSTLTLWLTRNHLLHFFCTFATRARPIRFPCPLVIIGQALQRLKIVWIIFERPFEHAKGMSKHTEAQADGASFCALGCRARHLHDSLAKLDQPFPVPIHLFHFLKERLCLNFFFEPLEALLQSVHCFHIKRVLLVGAAQETFRFGQMSLVQREHAALKRHAGLIRLVL